VRAVAAKYLVPDKLMVVAVGDATAIRPTLEKDIGPAQLRNADGQVLPK
jgi:hypothetical protein